MYQNCCELLTDKHDQHSNDNNFGGPDVSVVASQRHSAAVDREKGSTFLEVEQRLNKGPSDTRDERRSAETLDPRRR